MSDFQRLDMANARIRVLEIVTNRLPRTVDGEIIAPGDTVYRLYDGYTNKGNRFVCEETVAGIWQGGKVVTHEAAECPSSRLYSSREMAEAAIGRGAPIEFRAKRRKRGAA